MFCSQCGNRILDNSRFCGSCGARVLAPQEDNSIQFDSTAHNALVCTQCGSNKLSKLNDVYICASCGTKYAIDETKRVLVSISGGSVKIDNSDQLVSLVQLAYTEINSRNGEKALELSNRALEIRHDYLGAWLAKTLAAALMCDTNTVVSCMDCIDTYCNVMNKKEMFSDLFLCCFHAYMCNMETFLESSNNKLVNDSMSNFQELKSVASKLLALVVKMDKEYCNIPNDTVNYVLDFISRLNSLNEVCYYNSKYSMFYLEAIDDIGGICKTYLKIAQCVNNPYFEKGIADMIKCVYQIEWYGKIKEECEKNSKLNELFNKIDKEHEYYIERF